MALFTDSPHSSQWFEALEKMQSALVTLDETDAPDDIGPHLDLAICRLEDALGRNPAENSATNLRVQLEDAFADVMEASDGEPALLWA